VRDPRSTIAFAEDGTWVSRRMSQFEYRNMFSAGWVKAPAGDPTALPITEIRRYVVMPKGRIFLDVRYTEGGFVDREVPQGYFTVYGSRLRFRGMLGHLVDAEYRRS